MIREPTLFELVHVSQWLCDEDRRELALTRDPDDHFALAIDAFESQYKRIVMRRVPVMAFGAKIAPGATTALVWGFKTERGWAAIREVTKFIRRTMIPALHEQGINRAVCLVHPDNVASQTWLRHLGFSPRATTREIGTRHEEVILFQRDELQ